MLILHEAVSAEAPPEAQDTLLQAQMIEATLRELGIEAHTLAVGGDLDALRRQLSDLRPPMVFNLVESLAGVDGTAIAVPALLDGLGIPYTGSGAAALALTNDKCQAKSLMRRAGLPTANWYPGEQSFAPGTYLIKTRFEHSSLGIDDDAVQHFDDERSLGSTVEKRQQALGRPCFAEVYLDGREFNVALLECDGTLRVLPVAEIDFSAFEAARPRIVGYRAKWVPESFEYTHTPRCFPQLPSALQQRLHDLSTACFGLFGLRGYARVDFRLDAQGEPMILEVNPNPCLASDAGFVAALDAAGITFPSALGHLLSRAQCFA